MAENKEDLRVSSALNRKIDERVKKTTDSSVVYGTNDKGEPTTYELSELGGKLVKYNLTPQLDGIKTTFSIDEVITGSMATFITYMGLRYEIGDFYTIDATAHTLTTKFDSPLDKNEGRRLYLYVGGDVAETPGVGNEVDPVFGSSVAAGITSTKVGNWDAAYGWGDHGAVGYLKYYVAESEEEAESYSGGNKGVLVFF